MRLNDEHDARCNLSSTTIVSSRAFHPTNLEVLLVPDWNASGDCTCTRAHLEDDLKRDSASLEGLAHCHSLGHHGMVSPAGSPCVQQEEADEKVCHDMSDPLVHCVMS